MSKHESALYIHIPFCEKRCSYCDFYTVAKRTNAIPAYVDALPREIKLYAQDAFWKDQVFSTIFFGGGTPSLLEPAQVEAILTAAMRVFRFAGDVEITMEMNPGTTTDEKIRAWRETGVNRVSFGVQSFWADELRQVDREHSVEDVHRSVSEARSAGFENISLDLIFALPGQKPSRWKYNLEQAVALAPNHISAYNLSIEDGTPLFKLMKAGKVKPLTEWRERVIYNFTIDFLARHGYRQYEVSNFARPGFESRHNTKYWDGSPYLGLGASAHTFDGKRRFWNIDNYVHYINKLGQGKLPIKDDEILAEAQQRFEMIFLGLRQNSGIDSDAFNEKFSTTFVKDYAPQIEKLTRHSPPLLEFFDHHARLTREGLLLCDKVCAEFL